MLHAQRAYPVYYFKYNRRGCRLIVWILANNDSTNQHLLKAPAK